jgi:hypothetical protein
LKCGGDAPPPLISHHRCTTTRSKACEMAQGKFRGGIKQHSSAIVGCGRRTPGSGQPLHAVWCTMLTVRKDESRNMSICAPIEIVASWTSYSMSGPQGGISRRTRYWPSRRTRIDHQRSDSAVFTDKVAPVWT